MQTGEVIKFLRKNFNFTQEELATKLRVNVSSVQKYESGAVNNLKMETIRELCELFEVPPWLFIFPNHVKSEQVILNTIKFNHVRAFTVFNDIGLTKIAEYISDLSKIEEYKST